MTESLAASGSAVANALLKDARLCRPDLGRCLAAELADLEDVLGGLSTDVVQDGFAPFAVAREAASFVAGLPEVTEKRNGRSSVLPPQCGLGMRPLSPAPASRKA